MWAGLKGWEVVCAFGGVASSLMGVSSPGPAPQDRHILCWDLRVPDRPLLALPRRVATNQRVTFDLDP